MAPPTHTTRTAIVAAIDFSEVTDLVLDQAFRIGSVLGASPYVVHVGAHSGPDLYLHTQTGPAVFTPEDANKYLTAYVQDRLRDYQSRQGRADFDVAICHLLAGDPGREIARLAAEVDADLVVVGNVGRSNMRRLLIGSVAEKVVRLAPCPVFVVRQKTAHGAAQPEDLTP
jgi:nucleotide-binding universal stress UspA family protein